MANLNTRQLSINKSMTRPLMLLGCDRTLIAVSSIGCLYVGFNLGIAMGNIGVTIVAIVSWIVIRFTLVQMGKRDPFMMQVVIRSMQYTDRFLHMQLFIPANESVIYTKPPKYMLKRWLQ